MEFWIGQTKTTTGLATIGGALAWPIDDVEDANYVFENPNFTDH